MTNHQFGGQWTEEKLENLRKYLEAYLTIFKGNERARRHLRTIYMDAFAGTGYRTPKDLPKEPSMQLLPDEEADVEKFQKGSA